MSEYQAALKEFGMVVCGGAEYALTDQADLTSRLLPGGYTNYHEAFDGETYDFEMSASAINKNGEKYTVHWIFENVKGDNEHSLDSFCYDIADRVDKI